MESLALPLLVALFAAGLLAGWVRQVRF